MFNKTWVFIRHLRPFTSGTLNDDSRTYCKDNFKSWKVSDTPYHNSIQKVHLLLSFYLLTLWRIHTFYISVMTYK
jgi:hypothetical protein